MVGSVPPDEGCEVLDGELPDEEWDPRENENADESGAEEKNVWPDVPPSEDKPMPGNEPVAVDPLLKAELESLSKIEMAFNSEKKNTSANLLPFLVRVKICQNMLAEA